MSTPFAGLAADGVTTVRFLSYITPVVGVDASWTPVGVYPGSQGSGLEPPTILWDALNSKLWICITSGDAATADWGLVVLNASGGGSAITLIGDVLGGGVGTIATTLGVYGPGFGNYDLVTVDDSGRVQSAANLVYNPNDFINAFGSLSLAHPVLGRDPATADLILPGTTAATDTADLLVTGTHDVLVWQVLAQTTGPAQNYVLALYDGPPGDNLLLYEATGITSDSYADNAPFFIPALNSGTIQAQITNIDADATTLSLAMKYTT